MRPRTHKILILLSAVVTAAIFGIFLLLEATHPGDFSLGSISQGQAYDWGTLPDDYAGYLTTHLVLDVIFIVQYTAGFLFVATWVGARRAVFGWFLGIFAVLVLILDGAEDLLLLQHESFPVLSAVKLVSFVVLAISSLVGLICTRKA